MKFLQYLSNMRNPQGDKIFNQLKANTKPVEIEEVLMYIDAPENLQNTSERHQNKQQFING